MCKTKLIFLILIALIVNHVESRIIQYAEIPIASGGLIIKFVPNNDTKSSDNIGKLSIFLKMDDKKVFKMSSQDVSSDIPVIGNRVGISAAGCAKGFKRTGVRCKKI